MSASQFDIVFRGVREGYDVALAKAQFATLFKLDAAKVGRIFKSSNITLKHRIDERLANIFIRRLSAIGIVVDKLKTEPAISKAIYLQDSGECSTDSCAMHQPVDFVYAEHIRRIPFVFSGHGFDYFKLWFVNLLVSILSAGILYPWAQVRSLRYFYQHSRLDNHEFNYTGQPQTIFLIQCGLIAYLVLLAYSFFFSPFYFGIGVIVLLGILPFYCYKWKSFQQKHSFYNQLGFQQVSNLKTVYFIALGWPIIAVLSAGLLAPYAVYKAQEYRVQTTLLGANKFDFSARPNNYLPLLISLLSAECVIVACIYWRQYIHWYIFAAIIVCAMLLVFIHWRVTLIKLQWNNISSSLGYFVCSWSFSSYSKLALQNLLFCVLTLGFYWPWAKIRTAKYKAGHLAFFANQRFNKWQQRQH